jgi:outer membrane protein OmpA-like peptidoglycan-associated protein
MTTSDNDDISEILWPGYVDAVTNLALNLLFVIAVMSIVIMAVTLQMSKITKQDEEVERQNKVEQTLQTVEGLKIQLQQSEAEVRNLKTQLNAARQVASETQTRGSGVTTTRTEVVQAQAAARPENRDSVVADMRQGAIVVRFPVDGVALSEQDKQMLSQKLQGQDQTGAWEVRVIAQRGFSESLRLAYFRAQAVRSALIEMSVPATNIELRILETDQAQADNRQVLVLPK